MVDTFHAALPVGRDGEIDVQGLGIVADVRSERLGRWRDVHAGHFEQQTIGKMSLASESTKSPAASLTPSIR
jgi:hypothetical protein